MGHGPNYVLDKGWKVLSTYNSSSTSGVVRFQVVKLGAGDTIDIQTASNTASIGVVQESVEAAKVATGKVIAAVRMQGITKAIAGAPIVQGAEVMATTAGKCITAATTGNKVIGRA